MIHFYGKRTLAALGVLFSIQASAQCVSINCPTDITIYSDTACGSIVNYTAPVGFDACQIDSMVFNYSGAIETFNVPAGVSMVTIKAYGAQGGGGSNNGGKGAFMSGDFSVNGGDQLKVLVGQQGQTNYGYGGGGGSFVSTITNVPMIVAGGGGGAEHNDNFPGYDALTTNDGMNVESALGGTAGSGGEIGNPNTSGCGWSGSGGGGFYGNGGVSGDGGGDAFVNGGAGGIDPTANCVTGGLGGFGGGGAGGNAGGGGGGYSGGAGGANIGLVPNRGGGGAGSYNIGTNQSNLAGANTGNGKVVIKWYGTSAGVTTSLYQGLASGSEFPVGVSTVSYIATDGLGDADTCQFTVTVLDTISPVFNGTISDTASCTATVTNISPPSVSEFCSYDVTYTMSGSTSNSGIGDASGQSFNVGITTVTYTATDASGNSASIDFNVEVYSNPTVTADAAVDSMCVNSGAVALTGTPAGGVWTGTGVTGNSFDPSVSGQGTHVLTYTYTTANGCDVAATTSVLVTSCAGIDELLDLGIIVAPNPTSGIINIQVPESLSNSQLRVMDAKGGLLVASRQLTLGTNTIDLSGMETGIYYVSIVTSKGTYNSKIVLQ